MAPLAAHHFQSLLGYTHRSHSTYPDGDTASISGAGKCGVAVIRVSGPQSLPVLQSLAGPFDTTANRLQPRYAHLRTLRDPRTGEPIDRALAIWFPGPHSFTGEDSCEFQVHGGPAVVAAMLAALGSMAGLRSARAGEFTKRAFYAGKLDLTAVEGLADLIHAETEQQRRQALLQAGGSLAALYADWAARVLRCTAHLEAFIDFAEDQNLDGDTFGRLRLAVGELRAELAAHLRDGRRGELLRTGVRAAIVGAPNVGKSSFMNHVCGKPISIVAAVEGTTRDVVESAFNVGGFPVVLADTAGLREGSDDEVEREGMRRARVCATQAELMIVVVDAQRLERCAFDLERCLAEYGQELGVDARSSAAEQRRVVLVNKVDLIAGEGRREELRQKYADVVFVSCLEGTGIEEAVEAIAGHLKEL